MTQSIVDVGVIANTNNAKYLDVIAIEQSQVWSPDKDCIADIVVIGAGGGGGASSQASYSTASGGGAGGFCKKSNVTLLASDSNVLTLGAGGISAHSYNGGRHGGTGGASSFVGSSLNLVANGGGGGSSYLNSIGNGGNALGGDINLKGGSSVAASSHCASGGANVNVGFGSPNAPAMSQYTAGAGKGILGGDSGSISPNSSTVDSRIGGKGLSYIPNLDFLGLINISEPATPYAPGYNISQISTELKIEGQPSIGVGGTAQAIHTTTGNETITIVAQHGGWFAGGGAVYCGVSSTKYNLFIAGSGMLGGGGGASSCGSLGECFSGRGGDGVIFIAIKEYL